MSKPLFIHDCDGCVFLGRYQYRAETFDRKIGLRDYDLYICVSGLGQIDVSLIARYGSEGSEYASTLACMENPNDHFFALQHVHRVGGLDSHPLAVAYQRALARGLISDSCLDRRNGRIFAP